MSMWKQKRAFLSCPIHSGERWLPPQPFPPRRLGLGRATQNAGALADVGDAPAGQRGKAFDLLFVSRAQLGTIGRRRAASLVAGPRMAQDVAALEVRPVAGLLEHEILGEVRAVVPHVQAGEENVRCLAAAVAVAPEHAELPQLVAGERVGGAWIAPPLIPGVLEEHRVPAFDLDLTREHGFVEPAEFAAILQVN